MAVACAVCLCVFAAVTSAATTQLLHHEGKLPAVSQTLANVAVAESEIIQLPKYCREPPETGVILWYFLVFDK